MIICTLEFIEQVTSTSLTCLNGKEMCAYLKKVGGYYAFIIFIIIIYLFTLTYLFHII